MYASFRLDSLVKAIKEHGKPELFKTDQGAQFTIDNFTDVFLKIDIKISMSRYGLTLDNIFVERLWRSVKYEKCI